MVGFPDVEGGRWWDLVYAAITTNTRLFLSTMPRARCEAFLDLCSGTGIAALYVWYERNAELLANVLRDAEHHGPTREVNNLRFGGPGRAIGEVLGAGLGAGQRALLQLALSFFTWRTLAQQAGLKRDQAVAAMVRAIKAAKE